MDNESKVMCQQMEDTRTSLQDKLETLEQQVKDTVQETTDAVSGTVEAVKETVEAVKDTVQETVQSVKDTLNVSHMVHEHPWPMFVGAIGVGFVSARLLGSLSPSRVSSDEPARPAPGPKPATHRNGFSASSSAAQTPAPPQRSWWSFLTDHYSEELNKLKGLGIATVGNVVCTMLTENAAPAIAARAKEMIDGLVTKLGAKPIAEPIFKAGAEPKETVERKLGAYEGNLTALQQ
jgi:ElaB/YqjD/DUF883 family membrane-anchored ribosome-binding protein